MSERVSTLVSTCVQVSPAGLSGAGASLVVAASAVVVAADGVPTIHIAQEQYQINVLEYERTQQRMQAHHVVRSHAYETDNNNAEPHLAGT